MSAAHGEAYMKPAFAQDCFMPGSSGADCCIPSISRNSSLGSLFRSICSRMRSYGQCLFGHSRNSSNTFRLGYRGSEVHVNNLMRKLMATLILNVNNADVGALT